MKKQVVLEDMPDILTVRETANILRVSPITLKRWDKKRWLIPIRINPRGDRRYKKKDIQHFIRNNTV